MHDEGYKNEYIDNQLVRLYSPIVDESADDKGINIYITEDTELEKGITDTIANNFDNIIMRLLYDYLYWLLKEDKYIDDNARAEKWVSSENGDFINVEKMDKFLFLKYGEENINESLDLEAAYKCLEELILSGNEQLTTSRYKFINKHRKNSPYKTAESSEDTESPNNDDESSKENKDKPVTAENKNTEKNVQKKTKKTRQKKESDSKVTEEPNDSTKRDDSSSENPDAAKTQNENIIYL